MYEDNEMWENVQKWLQFRHPHGMLLLKEFIRDNILFLNCYKFSLCTCTATLEADIADVRSLLYTTSLLQNWQLNRYYYIHVRHALQYRGNKNQLRTSPDA